VSAQTQGTVPTWSLVALCLRCRAVFQELGGWECLSGRGGCGRGPHSLYGGGVVWLSATPNGGAPSVCAGRRPVMVGCLDCIDKKQQAVEKAWFAGAGVGFHQRFDLHLWHVQNSSALWLMLSCEW
jgi:hypothetical protein